MTTPAPSSPVAPTKTDLDDTYPQAYDFGEDLGLSEKGQASVGPKTSEEILAIKRLARYVLRVSPRHLARLASLDANLFHRVYLSRSTLPSKRDIRARLHPTSSVPFDRAGACARR